MSGHDRRAHIIALSPLAPLALGGPPRRDTTFKPSTDPLFVEKVRDIVGLYLDQMFA
jgi:hypothetical protein